MRLINRCKFTGLFSDLLIKPIKNIGLRAYVAYFSRNFAPETEIFTYGYIKMKGHAAMLAANSMWGLMAPLAKFVMIGGAVSSLVMTDLRVFGAMVLFWIFSFSKSLNMWVTRI